MPPCLFLGHVLVVGLGSSDVVGLGGTELLPDLLLCAPHMAVPAAEAGTIMTT